MSIWRGPNCIAGVSDVQKEGITKESVGLGNVDNTSDKDKPISEATQKALDELKNSVSDGKTKVANAITDKGVTTATDATFDTMATNITIMGTNQYNSGYSAGESDGYNEGNSAGYTTGYNAGVSATKKGTATAENVLTGKTFTNSSGVNLSGTMPNNGAVSQSLNAGGSYTVPKGYHDGTGKVTANSLASQTQATATSDKIEQGYTAWVNGQLVTGTQPP